MTIATAILAASGAGSALASPGDLDPSFSGDGLSTSLRDVGYRDNLRLGEDGSAYVLMAPYTVDGFGAIKVAANGAIDREFGSDGRAVARLGPDPYPSVLASTADGGLVVAGSIAAPGDTRQAALARFTSSGSLDPSFGSGGISLLDPTLITYLNEIEVAADGAIVVAGSFQREERYVPVVARVRADGSLDDGFGEGGALRLDAVDPARAIGVAALALGPNGSIDLGLSLRGERATTPGLLRLRSDGARDPSFSDDGLVELPASIGYGPDVEPRAPGGVVVAAPLARSDGVRKGPDLLVVALTATGALDPSFGVAGAASLELWPIDSNVDIAGRAGGGWVLSLPSRPQPQELELLGLSSGGGLDRSFGDEGRITTDVSGVGSMDGASGVEVDGDGRVVAYGLAMGRGATRHARVNGGVIARYLDSRGHADADADGVADRRDRCPLRWGDERRGCRVFPVRKLPIGFRPRIDDFRGNVYYAPAYRCSRGVVVKVFEKRPGADRLVGKSKKARNSQGRWEVSALAPPGRYYARVVARIVPEVGYCAFGVSKTIERNRRRG